MIYFASFFSVSVMFLLILFEVWLFINKCNGKLSLLQPNETQFLNISSPACDKKKNYLGMDFSSIISPVREPVDPFFGRESELKMLHRKMVRNKRMNTTSAFDQFTVLFGLHGVGKTELAREYIRLYNSDYDKNVIWINGCSGRDIKESFIDLAVRLNIIQPEESDYLVQPRFGQNSYFVDPVVTEADVNSDGIVTEIYRYFSDSESLFVFDNIGSYQDIQKYLPLYFTRNHYRPYIMIISSSGEWKTFESLELQPLSLNNSMIYLKNQLNLPTKEHHLKELAIALEGIPLAMKLATTFINKAKGSSETALREYVQTLSAQTRLVNRIFKVNMRTPLPVYTTLANTLFEVSLGDDKMLVRLILSYISNIISDYIPRRMLTAATASHSSFFWWNIKEHEIENALSLLTNYSLLTPSYVASERVFTIHSSIKDYFLGSTSTTVPTLLLILIRSNDILTIDRITATHLLTLIDYEKINSEYSVFGEKISEKIWLYEALFYSGMYSELDSITYDQYSKHCRDRYDTVECVYNSLWMAKARYGLRRYEKSMDLFSLMVSYLIPENLLSLESNFWIARVLFKQRKYDESLCTLSELLRLKTDANSKDNQEDLIVIKYWIARVLYHKRAFKECMDTLKQIEVVEKEMFQRYVYNNFTNLEYKKLYITSSIKYLKAVTSFALDDFYSSLSLFRNIYKFQVKQISHSSSQVQTINIKYWIAFSLQRLGMYTECLKVFREIYEKKEDLLSQNHPISISTKIQMAEMFHHLDDYLSSSELFKESNQTDVCFGESLERDEAYSMMITWFYTELNLAFTHEDVDLGSLLDVHQRISEIYGHRFGKYHSKVLRLDYLVGRQLFRRGKFFKSREVFLGLYDKCKTSFGSEHQKALEARAMLWNSMDCIFVNYFFIICIFVGCFGGPISIVYLFLRHRLRSASNSSA